MDNEISSIVDTKEYLDDDELGMKGYTYEDKLSWFMEEYVDIVLKIFLIFSIKNMMPNCRCYLELFRKRENIEYV
jgi:hypothetical protein